MASRTKGRWEQMPWVAERAPEGWKAAHQYNAATEVLGYEPLTNGEEEVEVNVRKRAWLDFLPKCTRSIRWSARSADPK